MAETTPHSVTRQSNPLALPLMVVSAVAVVEAVGLIVLAIALSRRPEPAPNAIAFQPPAATPTHAPPAPAADRATPANANTTPAASPAHNGVGAQGFVQGNKGQRVESAGFGITVEKITYEPYYKELASIHEGERYLALLLKVENNTGGNATLYPSQFRLQDDQGYGYDPLGVKLVTPILEWTTMGNRETIRGYTDFVIPKSAKGLTLIYSHDPQPIHIELGE
jgi:hypothetical protein